MAHPLVERLARFWLPLTLLLLPSPLFGYGSAEHTQLGDEGMRLALAYIATDEEVLCSSRPGLDNCLDDNDVRRLVELQSGQGHLSYGRLAAAVDYVVNPLKHLERQGNIACHPSEVSELLGDNLLHKRLLSAFRASHNNASHFQGELMMSIWFWHSAAVQAATLGRCPAPRGSAAAGGLDTLIGALVVNSVADHYLHDMFAPGHIATLRDTMNDANALAMHDRYNSLGIDFFVDGERWWTDLRPMLLESDLDGLMGLDRDAVLAAVGRIDRSYLVELWGDGDLHRSEDLMVFLAALNARSIVDVVEAYVTGEPVDHFDRYTWYQMKIVDGELHLPYAAIPYGHYPQMVRRKKRLAHGVVFNFELSGQGFEARRGGAAFRNNIAVDLSSGILAPGRKLPTGEIVPRFYAWDYALGWSWVDSETHSGNGPRGRITLSIPDVDMQFSVIAAYRGLSGQGTESDEWGGSLRWGVGFGLINVFLGLGYDRFIDDAGELTGAGDVEFGLVFSSPTTRLPGIGKLEKWRLRKKREQRAVKKWRVEEQSPH